MPTSHFHFQTADGTPFINVYQANPNRFAKKKSPFKVELQVYCDINGGTLKVCGCPDCSVKTIDKVKQKTPNHGTFGVIKSSRMEKEY